MAENDYVNDLEEKILAVIAQRLREGEMTEERAGEIAVYTLESLKPHMSLEIIYEKVQQFDINFPELLPAVLPLEIEYHDKMKAIVLMNVQKLIQENKIDEAAQELKNANAQDYS